MRLLVEYLVYYVQPLKKHRGSFVLHVLPTVTSTSIMKLVAECTKVFLHQHAKTLNRAEIWINE